MGQTVGRTHVRRRDRAVEDEAWIRALLHRAAVGSLAMSDADQQPFLNMNLFVYDGPRGVIYMHTARVSSVRETIERNPRVCFGVMEMGRVLPAPTAKNFSLEYASVMVFGQAEVVDESDETAYALQRLMDKYAAHLEPDRDYRPSSAEERQITSVYRVRIEAWSGKQRTAPPDFPDAFHYQPAPATG